MKKRSRFYYNLVEITLAMAVVGIGIAGIMALFVPALDASKEAVAESHASQVATTLLAYLERAKKNNWSFLPPSAEPDPKTELGFNDEGIPDTSGWGSEVLPGLYSLDGDGKYYGLKVGDGSQFCAFAKVWTSAVTVKDATESLEVPSGDFIRINVEISWPATVSPDDRKNRHYVRHYVLELSKPQ